MIFHKYFKFRYFTMFFFTHFYNYYKCSEIFMSFSDCLTKIEDKSKEKINWKKKIRDKRNVMLKIIDM